MCYCVYTSTDAPPPSPELEAHDPDSRARDMSRESGRRPGAMRAYGSSREAPTTAPDSRRGSVVPQAGPAIPPIALNAPHMEILPYHRTMDGRKTTA